MCDELGVEGSGDGGISSIDMDDCLMRDRDCLPTTPEFRRSCIYGIISFTRSKCGAKRSSEKGLLST